jgi:hypothetical protein
MARRGEGGERLRDYKGAQFAELGGTRSDDLM